MSTLNQWPTTVTELLGIFREALSVLVPIAEKAHIPWCDGQAYDDWDSIASSLYDNIVVNSINYATEVGQGIVLPKYDMMYPSYKDLAFIQVKSKGISEGEVAAFVGFAGTYPDFREVKWVRILPQGDAVVHELGSILYDTCSFFLVHTSGEKINKTHELTIQI